MTSEEDASMGLFSEAGLAVTRPESVEYRSELNAWRYQQRQGSTVNIFPSSHVLEQDGEFAESVAKLAAKLSCGKVDKGLARFIANTAYIVMEGEMNANGSELLQRLGLADPKNNGDLYECIRVIQNSSPEVIRSVLVPTLRRFQDTYHKIMDKCAEQGRQIARLETLAGLSKKDSIQGLQTSLALRQDIEMCLGHLAGDIIETVGSKIYEGHFKDFIQRLYDLTEQGYKTSDQSRRENETLRQDLQALRNQLDEYKALPDKDLAVKNSQSQENLQIGDHFSSGYESDGPDLPLAES